MNKSIFKSITMSKLFAFAVLVSSSLFIPTANATLIGDTVGCGITPTPFWVCSTDTAVVGAGVEFELDVPNASDTFGFFVDLDATSITISNSEDNLFNLGAGELLTLSDLNWVGSSGIIVGIENFTSSLVTDLVMSDVTFTDDSVTINIDSGASWDVGSYVSFDLITEHIPPVPVPAAVWLFGSGLLGLVGISRRKKTA